MGLGQGVSSRRKDPAIPKKDPPSRKRAGPARTAFVYLATGQESVSKHRSESWLQDFGVTGFAVWFRRSLATREVKVPIQHITVFGHCPYNLESIYP